MIEIGQYQIDEINSAFRDFNRDTLVPAIIVSLNELEEYWPLTVRQLYYRLVSKLIIQNNANRYKSLSGVVTKLRRMEIDGYDRCLVQNQENYVEIFVEKDALSGIFEDVAWPYCVRVVTNKGQSSATYINNYAKRAHAVRDNNRQWPIILYFGDLDPSGARIPVAIERSLKKYHNLTIDLRVVALKREQVESYDLPHSIDALKKSDPNYKWYRRNFGDIAVELDSIHPKDLQDLIKDELSKVLDIEDMLLQQQIQSRERAKFKDMKKQIEELMRTNGLL